MESKLKRVLIRTHQIVLKFPFFSGNSIKQLKLQLILTNF